MPMPGRLPAFSRRLPAFSRRHFRSISKVQFWAPNRTKSLSGPFMKEGIQDMDCRRLKKKQRNSYATKVVNGGGANCLSEGR